MSHALLDGTSMSEYVDGAPRDFRAPLRTWDEVVAFMFAGNARFTLVSRKTGARFTYRVKAKKGDAGSGDPTFFISLLRGPDNDADYTYVGVLRRDLGLRLTAASRMTRKAPAVQALVWALDAARNRCPVLGLSLEIWTEGRCCRCGRSLTVPESVADGIGPECRRRAA
jgi:Family of unknown function (DUF6011)